VKQAFVPDFLALLRRILARAPQIRGRRDLERRARRAVFAQSGTFAGHRSYTPGDDLRLLDWNALARSGELYVKQLQEEERRTLTLLVDCRPAMHVGSPPRVRGALRLAAVLGGLALARLDGLRVVLAPSDVRFLQGAAALPRLIETLASAPVERHEPADLVQTPLRRGWLGRVCWISDFARPSRFVGALAALRRHGREVTGFLPAIEDDRLPRAGGWIRVRDPDTGEEEAMLVDQDLRHALEDELRALHRQQDAVFQETGHPLLRVPMPAEGDYRLSSWFQVAWTSRI
jgi:uncharacterized protein (DUF58 family)